MDPASFRDWHHRPDGDDDITVVDGTLIPLPETPQHEQAGTPRQQPDNESGQHRFWFRFLIVITVISLVLIYFLVREAVSNYIFDGESIEEDFNDLSEDVQGRIDIEDR